MKVPLKNKLYCWFRSLIMKLCGHKYICCQKLWKRCSWCTRIHMK